MRCLLGDLDIITLYSELANKKFSYQAIINETELLTNLYYHQIRDGSQVLRVPSVDCSKSKLSQLGLYNKMESLLNLFVATAKKAIEKTAADIIIMGVVAATIDAENDSAKELELVETVIYLADFGVDAIAVVAKDWQSLKQSVVAIQGQASQPVAPFVTFKGLPVKILEDYFNFYEQLQLELLGFEIGPDDLPFLKKSPFFVNKIASSNLGLLLKNWNSQLDLQKLLNLLEKIKPAAIFAGTNTSRGWWNSFAQKYFG